MIWICYSCMSYNRLNTAISYNYEWISAQKIWILSDLSLQAFCSFTANWRWSNLIKRDFLCVFSSKCIEEKIHLKYSVYIQTTLTLHIWTVCPYHLGYFGNWNHTIFFEHNVKMSARFEEESHIQSINIVLLATIYIYIFFGGVQAVFFGGRQRVLLGKPRFNKRGCFPSILSCRYTFPGPGDSALPFGTGENPLWFGIQSHLLCGFFQHYLLVEGIRRKARKNGDSWWVRS